MRTIKAWTVVDRNGKPVGLRLPFIFRTRQLAKKEAESQNNFFGELGPHKPARCSIRSKTVSTV